MQTNPDILVPNENQEFFQINQGRDCQGSALKAFDWA